MRSKPSRPQGKLHGTSNCLSAEGVLSFDANRTVLALRGKDGVVFAVENILSSKLHEPLSNPRIQAVDKHIAFVWICVSLFFSDPLLQTSLSLRHLLVCTPTASWYEQID
jgi:hypothetical protein